jgi:hypothetical protein
VAFSPFSKNLPMPATLPAIRQSGLGLRFELCHIFTTLGEVAKS